MKTRKEKTRQQSPSGLLRAIAVGVVALLGGLSLTAADQVPVAAESTETSSTQSDGLKGFFSISSVEADASGDWGGDYGDVSGPGAAGQWYTLYPGSSGSPTAWARYNTLIWSAYGGFGADFLRDFRGMSPSEIEVCRSAEFIWYWSNNGGNNHIQANGNTHRTPLPTRAGAHDSRGRAASQEEWNAWIQYGTQIYPHWHTGNMSIICASDAWLQTDVEVEIVERESRRQNLDPIEFVGTTDIQVEIVPGIDFSNRIGQHTLERQQSVEITPYGELYNEVRSGRWNNRSHAELRAAMREAEARSNPFSANTSVSISTFLSENNRRAFSEGGVLNVTERYRTAQIELPATQQQERQRTRTYTCPTQYRTETRQSVLDARCELENVSAWSSWRNRGLPDEHAPRSLTFSAPQTSAGYQLLSVRCNEEGFNAALAAAPGSRQHDSGAGLSGALITPKQDLRGRAGSPQWIFGNRSGAQGAAGTNSINFFTKACDFQCVPEETSSGVEVTPGQSSASYIVGADAPSETISADYGDDARHVLALGRQNVNTMLKYSVPRINHRNIGRAVPIQTVVTRWEHGTPGPASGDGGMFSMVAYHDELEDGHKRLFRGNDQIFLRGDGRFTPGQNATVSVLDQVVDSFAVRANWASQAERPEVLNVSYVYEADMQQSSFYEINSGGVGGTSNYSQTMTTSRVYGHCGAATTGGRVSQSETSQLTGAGAEFTGNQQALANFSNQENLIIHFFRTVSER